MTGFVVGHWWQGRLGEGAGLFDGAVYSGEVAREVGLVDGVGEMRSELQKRYGRRVRQSRASPQALASSLPAAYAHLSPRCGL